MRMSPSFFVSFVVDVSITVVILLIVIAGITCSKPSLNTHISVSPSRSSYDYGSTVVFTCPEGYTRQGPDTAQCGGTGSWNRNSPTCRGEHSFLIIWATIFKYFQCTRSFIFHKNFVLLISRSSGYFN